VEFQGEKAIRPQTPLRQFEIRRRDASKILMKLLEATRVMSMASPKRVMSVRGMENVPAAPKRAQGTQGRFSALLATVCMVAALFLPGCASLQVTIPDSDPMRQPGYTEGYQKKTIHAYFWGLLLDPQVLTAECYGQGINDVIIYRTLAHDLAGVFTLGLWMPTEVYFRCKAPPARPGGILPSPLKRPRSRNIS
jgi:hypothetical protein